MGLDMWVTAKREYFSYREKPEENKVLQALKSVIAPIGGEATIETEAIYWRKCNHIHSWFVKNIQDGLDDCGAYPLLLEDLRTLRNTCTKILEDNSNALELLPTHAGFFFGSTDIDDRYFASLKYTVEKLDEWLELPDIEDWRFSYHSSW